MDLFARPTATPGRLAPWLVEMGTSLPGLLGAFRPVRPSIPRGSREQVVLAVTEVNGCRYTAWIHGAWRAYVGDDEADEALPLLLDYARDSALAGAPVAPTALDDALPPPAVRAVRATVAVAELSNLVGNSADGIWERILLRRPLAPLASLQEAAVVLTTLPLVTPLFAVAGAMRVASRLAPPMPEVVRPADQEANLVVHMLAEAVPRYLANALVRAIVLHLPGPVQLGVRAEGTEATVRISRSRVVLENGVGRDVPVIVDGGLELLLDVATRTLSRELAGLALRRP